MAYGFGGKGDNSRALLRTEIALIKQVFRTAELPSLAGVGNGPSVTIADGVNGNGGAWTDSDYQINVGKHLYERDLSVAAPSTLVHEMTHVWQYHHGTLSKAHAFGAQARAWAADKIYDAISDQAPAQTAIDELYSYDLDGSWNDMGFEGQAQMVEDWYDMGMKEEGYRYVFMKYVIWSRNAGTRPKTRVQLAMSELDVSEPAPVKVTAREARVPLTDSFLIGLLQARYAVDDVAGYGARARQVEQVFATTNAAEARPLSTRLTVRKPGDKVSMFFHDHLSTPTRTKLLQILQNRVAGK